MAKDTDKMPEAPGFEDIKREIKKNKSVKKETSQEREKVRDIEEKVTANFEKTVSIKGKKIQVNKGTLKIVRERDIAMDFATKVYSKFGKMLKSIVLFGSTAKKTNASDSDIDIVIIIDDCSVQWDDELTSWYREELGKIIKENPYKKTLHINTTRLSTWWDEMLRGEPLIINIIRYGESLIDFGGFFNPLKVLLSRGKIKSTPEAIYITLGRAPAHISRSKAAIISSIEGLYWAYVDAAHAALMANNVMPPSPEHISDLLKENFVDKKVLKKELVNWYEEMYELAHKIFRREEVDIKGREIDELQEKADTFVRTMAKITDDLTKV